MPLTTMWHEIGGHALACAVQGGHVAAIGAFYVNCEGLARWPNTDRRARRGGHGHAARLHRPCAVAAGDRRHGATGAVAGLRRQGVRRRGLSGLFRACRGSATWRPGLNGGGGLGPVPYPIGVPRRRGGGFGAGLCPARQAGDRDTDDDDRNGAARRARGTPGVSLMAITGRSVVAAVIVGLFNPVGIVITILSAAASSFGGLAGFISVGYAGERRRERRAPSCHRAAAGGDRRRRGGDAGLCGRIRSDAEILTDRSSKRNLCRGRAFHRTTATTRRQDADMKNVFPIVLALIPLAAMVGACVSS